MPALHRRPVRLFLPEASLAVFQTILWRGLVSHSFFKLLRMTGGDYFAGRVFLVAVGWRGRGKSTKTIVYRQCQKTSYIRRWKLCPLLCADSPIHSFMAWQTRLIEARLFSGSSETPPIIFVTAVSLRADTARVAIATRCAAPG